MTPTIQGLTHKQVLIADLIWSCHSQQEVEALVRALPTKEDQQTARALMQCMVHECLEELLDTYKEQADAAIALCR
jgi:hypothetical protein